MKTLFSNSLMLVASAMAGITGVLALSLEISWGWTLAMLSVPCFVASRALKS